MKKLFGLLTVVVGILFASCASTSQKVESFTFDFSKDFYPGIGYVCLNGSSFKDAHFVKADVVKNEYVFEKVSCTAALVPIYLTLNVTVQKDGKLNYEYSDLYYKKDKRKLELGPLVTVSSIENDFNKLLPKVFADETLYNATKAKFFEEPGMLQAMTKGLTDIRAAKFAEMVKDAPINMPVTVLEAKMNKAENNKNYKYYISAYASVSTLSSIHFVYYTNDAEKAEAAQGDKINIKGLIKDFSKNPYLIDFLAFTVVDAE
ncbi:hypothetical protein [uncultured Treponema sp.]|uniref:hypothetical protein n=1 Tax=uncultured Treponema sp. TaxID=162155 RepID=UPI0025F5E281|nr:hypothetical protein [uncultured Treponema sp.]